MPMPPPAFAVDRYASYKKIGAAFIRQVVC